MPRSPSPTKTKEQPSKRKPTKPEITPKVNSFRVPTPSPSKVPDLLKVQSKDIVVNVDAAPRVDISLTVGDVTQTVEVTSAAPVLQADRADVATTFSTTQLETDSQRESKLSSLSSC